MTNSFQKLPVPSFTSGPSFTDPELLFSTAGFTQTGVTIAGGHGILPVGTVLARKTSDKKYYVYDNNGSGGLEIARGVLRRAIDTGASGAPDQLSNMVIQGILKLSLVSGADADALTDLNARTDSTRDTFTF